QPRGVFRGGVKDNPMIRLAQAFGATALGLENTRFTFDPQLSFVKIRLGGHIAHQACRLMNIEIINDEMPFADGWLGCNGAFDMVKVVLLGSAGTTRDGAN